MKNLFKYSLALLTVALGFTACSDDDDNYTAGVPNSTAQVYFSNTASNAIEISADATSFEVPILRGDSTNELTVALNVTLPEGSIFTAPTEVKFEAGKAQSAITFTYDPANIVFGKYDTITVAIADPALTTQYGLTSFTFTAGVTAWAELGNGQYRDDLIATAYGTDQQKYDVAIEYHTVTPGLYRLVNPYGEAFPLNAPGDWDDTKDYYLTINATDPDFVYVEKGEIGTNYGDGMMTVSSVVAEKLSTTTLDDLKANSPELFGKLQDGIITMPANSMLMAETDYNGGNFYTVNSKGLFTVALPGHVIADYSIAFESTGFSVDKEKNEYVKGALTLGKDISKALYAVVSIAAEPESTFAGIIDGSISAEEGKAGKNTVETVVDGSNTYAIYVVAYNKNEIVAQERILFKHQSPFNTWKKVGTGTYNYTVLDLTADENGENGYGGVFDDLGSNKANLFQSEQNESLFRIAPWCDNEDGLTFTLAEDGTLYTYQNYTGYTDEEYGEVYATDLHSYDGTELYSYYSAEDGLYAFYLAYHDAEGAWGYVVDTFVPDAVASARLNSMKTKAFFKKNMKKISGKKIFKSNTKQRKH